MLTIDVQMKAELDLLPCFTDIESIAKIEQGDSHQSFKVVDQNKAYFVKRLTNIQNSKQINLTIEISRHLTISPTLVFTDQFWQVYEYINGQSLALTTLSIIDKIDCCLDVMVTCHQEINPLSTLQPYSKKGSFPSLNPREIITELSTKLSDQQKLFITKITAKLEQQLLVSPLVLCHGDINFTNIIIEKRAWLIDFECACLADAEFDIAMMIAVNELNYAPTKIIVEQCINSYQLKHKKKVGLSGDLVINYLFFCYLINGLWYRGQCGGESDYMFENKANKQFCYFDKLSFEGESLLKEMR